MITMNCFHEELKQIKEEFYKRSNHPYILKFINAPELDDDRLFLLYTMLTEKKVVKEKARQYILTTLLVQAALDTHEKVSVTNISSDKVKKQRQLSVLAGDFYSSLYYYLLSKMNDVSMIRLLANSIQEINESKMSVYKTHTNQSAKQIIDDIKKIESSLLQKMADHLKVPFWKTITSEYFLFKRLIRERELILAGVKTTFIHVAAKEQNTKLLGLFRDEDQQALRLEICEAYIEQSKKQLLSICNDTSSISQFVLKRVEQLLLNSGLLKEKVVEEG